MRSCSRDSPAKGFIALHTRMLPVLDVVHIQAAAVGETAATVQVGHIQVITLQSLQ